MDCHMDCPMIMVQIGEFLQARAMDCRMDCDGLRSSLTHGPLGWTAGLRSRTVQGHPGRCPRWIGEQGGGTVRPHKRMWPGERLSHRSTRACRLSGVDVMENSVSPKAVQTRYAGYHFRSRLEARWGVFFDSLGFEWRYEPETFPGYVPDFYIEQGNMWFEVKGSLDVSPGELDKCKSFAKPGVNFAMLIGDIPRTFVTWDTPGKRLVGIPAARLDERDIWTPSYGLLMLGHHAGRLQEALNAARSARFEHGQSGAS